MIKRDELVKFLHEYLNCSTYSDYGPNGLQIEGTDCIQKIAFAVSATKKSIEEAIDAKAQALIVHHGLFWQFHGPRPVVGPFAKRVVPLIKNEVNLLGYHLPLDAHLEVGNAKAIADLLSMENILPFGDYKGMPIGVSGTFPSPRTPHELKKALEGILNHQVIHAQASSQKIHSMGIITGGANGGWAESAKMGLDAYLTGEMSEHDWHESQEAGIHMFAGGHNATEAYGIQRLMELIKNEFKVECVYFPSPNPA